MSAGNTFHVEMTQMAHVSHVNSPSPAHTSAVSPTHPRMYTAASFDYDATKTLW